MKCPLFSRLMVVSLSLGLILNVPGVSMGADVVVTATKHAKSSHYVPYMVDSLDADELQLNQGRTLPEMLKVLPSVSVQKTAHGQGSPFIRGFTSFRTLLLVDGIRVNNSVFRSGPNQYWNTVDPCSIDHIEVVKGPSSVLYGSDAIGGTVNAFTALPGRQTSGKLIGEYRSAEDSFIGRGELDVFVNKKIAFRFGVTGKNFGDIDGGKDVGPMPKTGYDERAANGKIRLILNDDNEFILAHQRVDQDDAWRTHKTKFGIAWEGSTVGNEEERVLWQDRHLSYLRYKAKHLGPIAESFELTFSYHVQSEKQNRIRSNGRSDVQGFDVTTLGLGSTVGTSSEFGFITYGFDYYRDSVQSYKTDYNANGSLRSESIQGPVGDNARYSTLGFYVQDQIEATEQTEVTLGVRYTYAKAQVAEYQDPVSGNKADFNHNWDQVTGSLRLAHHPNDNINIFGGVSQGFRAPNLSDLTRLDSARTNEIETASPNLKAENYLAFDGGVKYSSKKFHGQLSYYYTDIHDMIITAPTGNVIGGNNEVTKRNDGKGHIQGVELLGQRDLKYGFGLQGSFGWMDGEVDAYPTSTTKKVREPKDRLMPTTSRLSLTYLSLAHKLNGSLDLVSARKADGINTRDAGDTQRIIPGGTPSYTVFNLRVKKELSKHLVMIAGVENITNKDYRIHGSGLNEPGRNFVFTVESKF